MCTNPNTRLLCRLIIDFLLLIFIYCIALIVLPQTLKTSGSGFHCHDTTLRFPYRKSSITKVHLTVLVVALPAAFIIVMELLRTAFVKQRAELKQHFVFVGVRIPSFISECYKIIGVYLFGLALTMIFTKITKYRTGKLRPYFFDVCQPNWGDDNPCPAFNTTSSFIQDYNCTEFGASAELLTMVRHSFPSGYTSTSTYAMVFLIAYAQVRIFAPWLRLLRTALQFICFGLAAFVASERVSSFQNHWSDVVAGVILGVGLAAFITAFVAHLFRRVRVKRSQWPRTEQIYGYAGNYNRATYGY